MAIRALIVDDEPLARQRLEGYFQSDAALTVDRDAAAGRTTVSVSLPFTRQEPRPQPGVEQVR